MSIINRVKQHISDNRGKYGTAVGAGAMYGASKIDSPLLNQAGFNVLAKGQNLALDVADKIDPRATTALNDLGMHKIRQEDIDASNALYNSGVAKFINPNPVDMVNANEHSTEVYNKAMAAKASAQDALVNAKNQGQDYIDQGVNYIKGLNPFTESTITIPIKDMLLEGYQPEEITEMVHVNNERYSKLLPNNDRSNLAGEKNILRRLINNKINNSKQLNKSLENTYIKGKNRTELTDDMRLRAFKVFDQNNIDIDKAKGMRKYLISNPGYTLTKDNNIVKDIDFLRNISRNGIPILKNKI